MNVTCTNCKVVMKCLAKRQNKGRELTTMSDYRCPSCNFEVTIGRKGTRPQEDISRDSKTRENKGG